jgi:DNA-binding response OmpR family regulator
MEPGQLAGRTVLLVEDEPLIALEITESLRSACATVTAARTLQEGLRLAEQPHLTAAILDFALGTDDATALCERLTEREIPFMFYSGRTPEFNEWRDVPFVSKPAAGETIVATLADLLIRAQRPHKAEPRWLLTRRPRQEYP